MPRQRSERAPGRRRVNGARPDYDPRPARRSRTVKRTLKTPPTFGDLSDAELRRIADDDERNPAGAATARAALKRRERDRLLTARRDPTCEDAARERIDAAFDALESVPTDA
jgi:hypothetical protein